MAKTCRKCQQLRISVALLLTAFLLIGVMTAQIHVF